MSGATEICSQMGSLIISGKSFPLYKGLNLIGRSRKATVILRNPNISQQQSIITIVDENQHFLSDVNSANGTILNKNKLRPLNLYALDQDSIIEFANVLAIYKKEPYDNEVADPHFGNGSLESTQSVSDFFYSQNTQHLERPSTSEEHHNAYFDDDYDFNNLPSPPSVTRITPVKKDVLIHEMATQIYKNIETVNQNQISNAENQLTIHDLPTQLIFNDVIINNCDNEITKENSITSLPIYLKQSQVLNENDIMVPQTQGSPHLGIDKKLLNVSDVIDATVINDASYTEIEEQNISSMNVIQCTPFKENTNRNLAITTKSAILDIKKIVQPKNKSQPFNLDTEAKPANKDLKNNCSHQMDTDFDCERCNSITNVTAGEPNKCFAESVKNKYKHLKTSLRKFEESSKMDSETEIELGTNHGNTSELEYCNGITEINDLSLEKPHSTNNLLSLTNKQSCPIHLESEINTEIETNHCKGNHSGSENSNVGKCSTRINKLSSEDDKRATLQNHHSEMKLLSPKVNEENSKIGSESGMDVELEDNQNKGIKCNFGKRRKRIHKLSSEDDETASLKIFEGETKSLSPRINEGSSKIDSESETDIELEATKDNGTNWLIENNRKRGFRLFSQDDENLSLEKICSETKSASQKIHKKISKINSESDIDLEPDINQDKENNSAHNGSNWFINRYRGKILKLPSESDENVSLEKAYNKTNNLSPKIHKESSKIDSESGTDIEVEINQDKEYNSTHRTKLSSENDKHATLEKVCNETNELDKCSETKSSYPRIHEESSKIDSGSETDIELEDNQNKGTNCNFGKRRKRIHKLSSEDDETASLKILGGETKSLSPKIDLESKTDIELETTKDNGTSWFIKNNRKSVFKPFSQDDENVSLEKLCSETKSATPKIQKKNSKIISVSDIDMERDINWDKESNSTHNVSNWFINRHRRKILKLSSESDENASFEEPYNKTKYSSPKIHKESSKIDSESDTDIEVEINQDKEYNSTHRTKLSSENDKHATLEKVCNETNELDKCSETKSSYRRIHEESSKIDSGSETDIELEVETHKYTKSSTNDSHSNQLPNENYICENNNNSKASNPEETLCIPSTQCSDDDDSTDFNFMSVRTYAQDTSKHDVDTQGSVLNISQKLNEIRQSTLLQINYSEESIHFSLTENTDNHSGTVSNVTADENDDKVNFHEVNTQKIDKDLQVVRVKNVENSSVKDQGVLFESSDTNNESVQIDDIFIQVTQQHVAKNIDVQDDIFDVATQLVDNIPPSLNIMPPCKDGNIFKQLTPNSMKSYSKTTTTDDIFLQATQKTDNPSELHHEITRLVNSCESSFKTVNAPMLSNEEEISLQSSQVENINNEGDILLQPTQQLYLDNNKSPTERNNLPVNQSILKNSSLQIASSDPQNEDIFLQSTQALFIKEFLPPEKVVCIEKLNNEDNIYDQPTQEVLPVLSTTNKGSEISGMHNINDDIFFQPTQAIDQLKVNPGKKLPLHNVPKAFDVDKEESQLEVIFASQTVRLCSQTNTRPSNPLVNVLEKSDQDGELSETLLSDHSDSDSKIIIHCERNDNNSSLKKQSKHFKAEDENGLSASVITISSRQEKNITKRVKRKTIVDNKLLEEFVTSCIDSVVTNSSSSESNDNESLPSKSNHFAINTKQERNKTMKPPRSTRHNKLGSEIQTTPQSSTADEAQTQTSNKKARKKPNTANDEGKRSKTKKSRIEHVTEKNSSIVVKNLDLEQHKNFTKASDPVHVQNSNQLKFRKNQRLNESMQSYESSSSDEESFKKRRMNTAGKSKQKAAAIKTKLNQDLKIVENTVGAVGKTRKAFVIEENKKIRNPKLKRKQVLHEELDNTQTNSCLISTSENSNQLQLRKKQGFNESMQSYESSSSDEEPQKKLRMNAAGKSKQKAAAAKTNLNRDLKIVENTVGAVGKTRRAVVIGENEKNRNPKLKRKQVLQEELDNTQTNSSLISTPERQRRLQKPKVVFTMLDDVTLQSIIRRLGGTVVDSVKSCTVLVTASLKRSLKLLSAVGEAKPICGPDWLHASKKAGTFLDPWDHLLADEEAEEKWNFSLKQSLSRSANKKLLEGISFHVITTNNADVLKAAIQTCGGRLLSRVPVKNADGTIIIGNPDLRKKYLKFLQKSPPLKVVTPEAIFDGVLRQELHWDDHLLT